MSVSVEELQRLRSLGRIARETDLQGGDAGSDSGSESGGSDLFALRAADELAAARKRTVSDAAGLRAALSSIVLRKPTTGEEAPWVESLRVSSGPSLELDDVHDDLSRELAIFRSARSAAESALERLDTLGIAHRRPLDYYAEMLKTDEHMARVRERLARDRKAVEEGEERRRQRDLRKFGKKVQVERGLERAKEKREALEGIKRWRKQGGAAGKGGDAELEKMLGGGGAQASAKRKRKDDRYGFGGKKRGVRKNDKNSVDDVAGFSLRKNRAGTGAAAFGKGKGRGKGRGAASNRPGKARRNAQFNKR